MIYALWEILIPLLIAFVLGVLLGWFIWRWRRLRVTGSEWAALQQRADSNAASSADADKRVVRLTADVEVRNMEIEQLRKSDTAARAKIAELQSVLSGSQSPSGDATTRSRR